MSGFQSEGVNTPDLAENSEGVLSLEVTGAAGFAMRSFRRNVLERSILPRIGSAITVVIISPGGEFVSA